MQIRFMVPIFKPWAKSHAYQRQVRHRTVASVSDYSTVYRTYHREMQKVSELVHENIPEVESVMLCGVGGSHEEVRLILDNFPTVENIHLVDWHRPNLEFIKHRFLQHPIQGREVCLTLHLTDLRQPESLDQESVDFAFANRVFDLYHKRPIETQEILWGIASRLKHGGMLFSFDYPFDMETEGRDFYGLAGACGLDRIEDRLLKKTL